jgi:hypothetical protein
MESTEALTRDDRRMTLRVAFNYGGRSELADAAARAAADHAAGRLARVDEDAIAARLYDPDMPDVDLLVRTSGEQRVSNYLLWQAAYAELVFTATLWPDFDRHELARCVAAYQARDRASGEPWMRRCCCPPRRRSTAPSRTRSAPRRHLRHLRHHRHHHRHGARTAGSRVAVRAGRRARRG